MKIAPKKVNDTARQMQVALIAALKAAGYSRVTSQYAAYGDGYQIGISVTEKSTAKVAKIANAVANNLRNEIKLMGYYDASRRFVIRGRQVPYIMTEMGTRIADKPIGYCPSDKKAAREVELNTLTSNITGYKKAGRDVVSIVLYIGMRKGMTFPKPEFFDTKVVYIETRTGKWEPIKPTR